MLSDESRAPVVSFSVESDRDAPITFVARPRAPRARRPAARPSSLRLADDAAHDARLAARSLSAEGASRLPASPPHSPVLDLKPRGLRRTADALRHVGSAERLAWLRDRLAPRAPSPRDDESAPLVGARPSPPDGTASTEVSPRSDPSGGSADLDLLPEGKDAEPYSMRLLTHGACDGLRSLWRQDALDCDPPWHEPDSAV